jgi:alkanesulfonate monooxygenase SsuD/methylene tetrahydromethanopterin reductase-like flavin-dependent oxidoreductase (luciferase family)
MKFSIFGPVGYEVDPDEVKKLSGWPWGSEVFDPSRAIVSMDHAIELFEVADDVGFDWLATAEHHYAPRQMTPNPTLTAALLSQRARNAQVALLGVDLPLTDPIRAAEEIAMVDVFCGGKFAMAGFFRGTPNEYLTYGTNAAESRDMYEEGVELVVKAWTEPEPFGWEGRHYRHRLVSIWPRPIQQPHPPVLVSGNSPSSSDYAIRNRFNIGIAFVPMPVAQKAAAYFRQAAADDGWEVTQDNILYRCFAYVAETDEKARQDCIDHDFGGVGGVLTPRFDQINPIMPAMMEVGAAYGGGPPPTRSPGDPPMLPPICGSPETVFNQVKEIHDKVGNGVLDLILNGDTLPYELARRSVELFGKEVIPQARDL